MNQTKQIESHLKRGKSITPLQALSRFGCLRLSARIYDLRKNGLDVKTENVNKGGKVYAKYFL